MKKKGLCFRLILGSEQLQGHQRGLQVIAEKHSHNPLQNGELLYYLILVQLKQKSYNIIAAALYLKRYESGFHFLYL